MGLGGGSNNEEKAEFGDGYNDECQRKSSAKEGEEQE